MQDSFCGLPLEIGMPMGIRNIHDPDVRGVLGRLVVIDGGVFTIETPHGSRVHAGLVHTFRLDEERLALLTGYERDAKPLYPYGYATHLERFRTLLGRGADPVAPEPLWEPSASTPRDQVAEAAAHYGVSGAEALAAVATPDKIRAVLKLVADGGRIAALRERMPEDLRHLQPGWTIQSLLVFGPREIHPDELRQFPYMVAELRLYWPETIEFPEGIAEQAAMGQLMNLLDTFRDLKGRPMPRAKVPEIMALVDTIMAEAVVPG